MKQYTITVLQGHHTINTTDKISHSNAYEIKPQGFYQNFQAFSQNHMTFCQNHTTFC